MTFRPEFVFYGLVLVLAISTGQFLRWWWRDISISTSAIQIAHKILASLGIGRTSSHEQIQATLVPLRAHEKNSSEEQIYRKLIVASLYVMKDELNLDHRFFAELSTIPGFESSKIFSPHRIDGGLIADWLLANNHSNINEGKALDEVACRLDESLVGLQETEKIHKARIAA